MYLAEVASRRTIRRHRSTQRVSTDGTCTPPDLLLELVSQGGSPVGTQPRHFKKTDLRRSGVGNPLPELLALRP